MKKILLLTMFVFYHASVMSQYLSYSEPNAYLKLIDSSNIEQVVVTYTSYFSKKPQTTRSIYDLNEVGMPQKITFFDNENVFKESIEFFKKSVNKFDRAIIISKANREFNFPDTMKLSFLYDKNFLTQTTATNTMDSILFTRNFVYNSKGDRIKSSYDTIPEFISWIMPEYSCDSIFYDYENNMYYSFTLARSGEQLGSSFSVINFKLDQSNKFDKFGNLVENKFSKMDYIYDSVGNWIRLDSYQNINGDLKLQFQKKRRIKYRNAISRD